MYVMPPWGLDPCLPPIFISDDDLSIHNVSIGPAGPQGEPGPAGSVNPLTTTQVSASYQVLDTDDYVGVTPTAPITITLPPNTYSGNWIIIKLEVGAPVGARKVTITTSDNTTIDGVATKVLQQPYECVQLLFASGKWNKIA